MMVDNALDILQVKLRGCGDARLEKGRTQKFQSVDVHSTDSSVRAFKRIGKMFTNTKPHRS